MADESPLKFPCQFPIKAMGHADVGLEHIMLNIAQRFDPAFHQGKLRTVSSRNKNYISVTITITATSREQLDNVYRAITSRDEVLFAL